MKFAFKSLVAAAALVSMGASHAVTATLTTTNTVTDSGWTLSNMSGTGRLTFSDTLISALNTASVQFETVAPADLTAPKDPTTGKYTKGGTAFVNAPVSSLTGNFDGTTLSVTEVVTAGGAKQITIKNGATNGAGFLVIENLTVDLNAKLIKADLSGGNGFASVKGYNLWTFETLQGPTTFSVPNPAVETVFNVDNALRGLFFVNQVDGLDKFALALNLNSTGRAALKAVDNKLSTSNKDPVTGQAAGFGWINSSITVTATPVPEPSTYALMVVGLAGVAFAARRRAK